MISYNDVITEKVAFRKPLKIKLVDLTREDCKKVPKLYKYFRNGNTELDRFHIPEIDEKTYRRIASTFKQTDRFDKANLELATASDYYIRKARVIAVAEDLGVKPSLISTEDYSWNEAFYTEYSFWRNIDILDDAWRDSSNDLRFATANECYLGGEYRTKTIDTELIDALYKFCFTAIKHRLVMVCCKVEQCLKFLNSIIESSNGLSENISITQHATLKSYETYFAELLNDKDFVEFIRKNNDIELFANNEECRQDYIDTYTGILRSITRDSSLEDFRTWFYVENDPCIEDILHSENIEIVSGAYLDNLKA